MLGGGIWKGSLSSSGDHGSLTGLSDDDHAQYAMRLGRALGQVIYGGTAGSETLTLYSTSNATKGKVLIDAWSAFDEVNQRLGVGTVSPAVKVHQDGGNATANYLKFTAGTTTGTTSSDGFDIGIASDGNAEIRQREALPINFYTNNTQKMTILSNGYVGINTVSPTSLFTIFTSQSGTPSDTVGSSFQIASGSAFNDNSTSASGTATGFTNFGCGTITLTATNASVTTTAAHNLLIRGPVAAGTNQSITTSYGVRIPTAAVGATVTNAYAIHATAPTGATNNFCAALLGPVGINTLATLRIALSVSGAGSGTAPNALNGSALTIANGTFTDGTTAASGTLGTFNYSSINGGVLAATNSSVTCTTASSFAIAAVPTQGTNMTITSTYGLRIAPTGGTGSTNSYGLRCDAATGATNNYAATFAGGYVGNGLQTPVTRLHQTDGNATATYLKFTCGTTTGSTSTDGFDIGLDSSANVELRQRENLSMKFYTNNTQYLTLSSGGLFGIGAGATTPASTLHVDGTVQFKVTSVSTNTTLGTHFYVLVDDSGATRTMTLPAASSTIIGRIYHVKKQSASNTTVIAAAGSDTIDGAASVTLTTQYETKRIVCSTATTWAVF